jgi:hypothetical protein
MLYRIEHLNAKKHGEHHNEDKEEASQNLLKMKSRFNETSACRIINFATDAGITRPTTHAGDNADALAVQMHFTKKKDVGTTDQADPTACLKNQSRGEVCRSHCAVAPLLA